LVKAFRRDCVLIFRMAGRVGEPGGRGQETRRVSRDRYNKRRDFRVRQELRTALGRVQLGFAFPVVHARRVRPVEQTAGYHASV